MHKHRRTKIVCTMGPAVNNKEKIEALLAAGMNVARLNFSHGTHAEHAHTIELLQAAREHLQIPLAIMLDTKGPEIRLGKVRNNHVHLKEGDEVWLVKENIEGNEREIPITPSHVIDALQKDMVVLIDNGNITTRVVEVNDKGAKVYIEHGGVVRSSKGVNIPGADITLPMMTAQDMEDIRFGCHHGIDLIAASFVQSAEHVMAIKKLVESEGKGEIAIIAKIENRFGVQHIDSIIQAADGIMIARGDLGVELPLKQVPKLQKMIIRKCYLGGKPSVTATQMLESMMHSPRPTRAEASDVANAIYDSTSAAMLSGETAVGQFPVETVRVMHDIIEETESDVKYIEFSRQYVHRVFPDVASSVALACVKTAYSANAKAIFAFTTSGLTAKLLSRLRPEMPIIAMTPNLKVYHQLALGWGVVPLLCSDSRTIEDATRRITSFALERGYVKYGDLVIITAGSPFGRTGTTNMMIVDSIGDVLVRGDSGYGVRTSGHIALIPAPEHAKDYEVKGKILVLTSCDATCLSLLTHAAGVILQNHVDDTASENYLKTLARSLNLPIVLRAEGASTTLRDEQLVTLDPEQATIYKGIV